MTARKKAIPAEVQLLSPEVSKKICRSIKPKRTGHVCGVRYNADLSAFNILKISFRIRKKRLSGTKKTKSSCIANQASSISSWTHPVSRQISDTLVTQLYIKRETFRGFLNRYQDPDETRSNLFL